MRVIDAHRAGHHQVEIDERRLARLAGAQIVRFDRALGIGLDRRTDLVELLLGHGHVHQPAHAMRQKPRARPEDVEPHKRRKQGIEQGLARREHQQQPHDHAGRGDDVGPKMMSVRFERRRLQPAALADQHQAPNPVDRRGHDRNGDA